MENETLNNLNTPVTPPASAPSVESRPEAGSQRFGRQRGGRGGGQGRGGFGGRGRRPGGRGGFANKSEYDQKVLEIARVSRVTKGGKRFSFRATIVIGDGKGKVGVGMAKGKDVAQSVQKAFNQAKKNLVTVLIVDGTIPYQVEAIVGPARILLKPQRKGRGLVAGGAVRMICDLAGIKNVSSKILSGSKNKLNNARATMEALKKLRTRN